MRHGPSDEKQNAKILIFRREKENVACQKSTYFLPVRLSLLLSPSSVPSF